LHPIPDLEFQQGPLLNVTTSDQKKKVNANRKTSVARNMNDTGQMQTTSFSLGI